MSSRLHNKFHRHNHHTSPPSNNDPRYPDASYDPIASYTSPFQGPFVATVSLCASNVPSVGTADSIGNIPAIDVYGDVNVSGNIISTAAGQFIGNGAGIYGITTTSIVNLSGSPYQYGSGNPNPSSSAIPSLSSAGNTTQSDFTTIAGGSGNFIGSNNPFSFIAGGSANRINNNSNTFVLGSNISTSLNNYTYVNNLSSLGNVYATTIGASTINGNGNGINLSTSSLSATTTTLVNNTSSNLVTLTNTTSSNLVTLTNTVSGNLVTLTNNTSANLVTLTNTVSTSLNNSITGLQTLSGNWQSTYSLFSTTTATTFNVKGLSATGLISASAFNASNGFYSTSAFSGTYTDGIVTDYVTGLGRISVGSNDALAFYNGGPANTATVMVCANGNVGIGTTVPSSKLTVVGDISATGAVYSTIGTPTYYETTVSSSNISTTYVPVFTAAPTVSADYLAANAKYEIIYDIYYSPAQPAGSYFALSANNILFANANITYLNSPSIDTSNVTYRTNYISEGGISNNTSTNLLELPQCANGALNSGTNNISIRAYIKTTNTPGYVWLVAKTFNNAAYNINILQNSYRKITRVF
jgi:hypothetical protein